MPKPFAELLAACRRSAVHLEMRDTYSPDDPVFHRWLAGEHIDWLAGEDERRWHGLVRQTVARGVVMRRARIISEPLSDHVRHEYEATDALNVDAGEIVRWLPRDQASDLALPGNDCWVLDERLVLFGHFAGDGRHLRNEVTEEPSVVKLCTSAFEAVWERAIPHEDYHPR